MISYVSRNSWATRLIAGVVVLAALSAQSTAKAEWLAADGNAIAGWHGSVSILPAANAKINYAVFAPGDITKTFADWTDPTGGTGYVYAYELFNLGGSGDYIKYLTVNLQGNEMAANVSEIPIPGTPSPRHSDGSTLSTSVKWNYTLANRVYGGETSNILIFTSPYRPEWDLSMIQYNVIPVNVPGGLPSPIPEPSTLFGLAIAGALVLMFHRFRGNMPQ